MNKPLADSTMTNDPAYTRQVVTIRKDFYERLRKMAHADPVRRMKIGDVIEACLQAVEESAYAEVRFCEILRDKRAEIKPATKREIAAQLRKLTPEQAIRLMELAKNEPT